VAFCLLYLWLVLLPLIGYHQKLQRRIAHSWDGLQQLESSLGKYTSTVLPVRDLIRRATAAGRKASGRRQLETIVRQVWKGRDLVPSLSFETLWEGEGVTLKRCKLKGKASPDELFSLIQIIDHRYLPMRVARWDLKHTGEGSWDLDMEIYLLEASRKP